MKCPRPLALAATLALVACPGLSATACPTCRETATNSHFATTPGEIESGAAAGRFDASIYALLGAVVVAAACATRGLAGGSRSSRRRS